MLRSTTPDSSRRACESHRSGSRRVASTGRPGVKIALFSYEYPPETGFGGIGTYTWHHARGLAKLGHEVHVLAGAKEPTEMATTEQGGVVVHRFWADGAVMAGFHRLGAFKMWWSRQRLENAFSMLRGFSVLHRLHDFDVIEVPECGAEGALLIGKFDLPSVVRLHSPSRLIMPYYDVNRADLRLCGAVERRPLVRASALTACSQFVADEMTRELSGLGQPTVITNGLDLDWLDSMEGTIDVFERYDIPRDQPMILFSGRLERRKGVHLLPEIAAALLEKFKVSLVLAGDDLFGYAERKLLPFLSSRELKGSLHLLGSVPLNPVRQLLRKADVVLLPSLWENCPYSVLEAMGVGRAVVCSDQGGIPELIRDGVNGRLAAPNDAGSFVRVVEELIEDREQRDRLGAASRATIFARHDSTETARQTLHVYEALVGARADAM